MSTTSHQETIEALESSIKEISEQAKVYEELKALAKAIPNILRLEQTIAAYKKKSKDLKETLKINKNLVRLVKENTLTFSNKLGAKLAGFKQNSENKLANENSIKDVIAEKKLEIYFKEEVCGLVKHVENAISSQNNLISEELSQVRLEVTKRKMRDDGEQVIDEEVNCRKQTISKDLQLKISRIADKDFIEVQGKCNQIGEEKLSLLEENYQCVIKTLIPNTR